MILSSSLSYSHSVPGDGPEDAPIVLLIDCPATSDEYTGRPLSGATGQVYLSQFRKAGIPRRLIRIESVCEHTIEGSIGGIYGKSLSKFYRLDSAERDYWRANATKRLLDLEPKIIIPAGNEALTLVTGKKSLSKWHLSPLTSKGVFSECFTLPLLDPHYIAKKMGELPFVTLGAEIVKSFLDHGHNPVARNFIVKPSPDEAIAWIDNALEKGEWLSADIETGMGQITCIGFSIDPREAICIPTLPRNFDSPEDFFRVWQAIAKLLESSLKKTGQNLFYDATYLSAYGIRVLNIIHDTMVANKYIYPEFSKGLDTVNRLFVGEPYWKDEAKDWTARQNPEELYIYNCKDAACTLQATFAQIQELISQGLYNSFIELAMDLWSPAAEMCWTGLPVRKETRERLRVETTEEIIKWTKILDSEADTTMGKPVNQKSPKQVKEFLRYLGFKIPIKKGKESSDYESLLKLQLKAPESKPIKALIKLSKLQKRLSSYLSYRFDETTSRMHSALYISSTETGRWSGGTDAWDRGINIETIPGEVKEQFGYDK